jgi:competence protein ComEA
MTERDSPATAPWFAGLKRDRLKRRLSIAVISGLVIIGLALGLPALISPSKSLKIAIPEPAEGNFVTPRASPAGDPHSSLRGTVIIHVAGAVLKPGLIVLTVGDRVVDAILRAGGLSPTADQCAVNLARIVTDGEQIIVPTTQGGQSSCLSISSTSGGSSIHSSNTTKTSLSRATLDQLDALPGVGPALAQRIIDWRTAHGGFQSVDQLDDVSGIGAKLMASLKPLVVP